MNPDPGWFGAISLNDPQSWNLYEYARNNPLFNVDPDGYDCVYLNNAGTDMDKDANGKVTGIDTHSNASECGKKGGYWVDGAFDHGTVFSNSNDVALTGHTTGSDGSQTSTDAYYTNATGQNSDIIAAMGYSGLTGTVDLVGLAKNRISSYVTATPWFNRSGCGTDAVVNLARDLSGYGLASDGVDALQQGSVAPLVRGTNSVELAGKAADHLSENAVAQGALRSLSKSLGSPMSMRRAGALMGATGKFAGRAANGIAVATAGYDFMTCMVR